MSDTDKNTMDEVFKVIDKHIGYLDEMFNEAMMHKQLAKTLDIPSENYDREMMDFASAIASLKMLKRELSGEIVY